MGGRKKLRTVRELRPRLQFFDGEKRPPFGITAGDQKRNDQAANLMNRIAELEATIAGYSRGDELAFLSKQARERLAYLTQSGLYGTSDRETATQLLNAALRAPDLCEQQRDAKWQPYENRHERKKRR